MYPPAHTSDPGVPPRRSDDRPVGTEPGVRPPSILNNTVPALLHFHRGRTRESSIGTDQLRFVIWSSRDHDFIDISLFSSSREHYVPRARSKRSYGHRTGPVPTASEQQPDHHTSGER